MPSVFKAARRRKHRHSSKSTAPGSVNFFFVNVLDNKARSLLFFM